MDRQEEYLAQMFDWYHQPTGENGELKMKNSVLLLLLISALCLSSCANPAKEQQDADMSGTSGRNTEATLVGGANGTVLGYIVTTEMNKYDRQKLNQAYEDGPADQPTSWQNPDNANTYQIIPQPAYTQPQSPQTPCRRAEIVATINGKTQRTYTTACRNSTGQWELQN